MRPRRSASGPTLLQLLVVVFVVSILGALFVSQIVPSQVRRTEVRMESALKQIVSTEGVWRGTDSDRNGACDYWTADVAGFYGLQDGNGAQLRYLDAQIAAADVAPVAKYAGLSADAHRPTYTIRAMVTDATGMPYVDPSSSPVRATPARGMKATNSSKYAFCAFVDARWGGAASQFFVDEEGVVYRADTRWPMPLTTWPVPSEPSRYCLERE